MFRECNIFDPPYKSPSEGHVYTELGFTHDV